MFQFGSREKRPRRAPRRVVIYNYYYGFTSPTSAGAEAHEPGEIDSPIRFMMPRAVCDELLQALGGVPPEACGMLLGPRTHPSLLTHFLRDESGHSSPATFRIDGDRMTDAIKPYVSAGLDVKGIVHSHPSGIHRPSSGDVEYLKKLFGNKKNATAPDAMAFYFPILSDGQLFHFAYDRADGDRLKPARLGLI